VVRVRNARKLLSGEHHTPLGLATPFGGEVRVISLNSLRVSGKNKNSKRARNRAKKYFGNPLHSLGINESRRSLLNSVKLDVHSRLDVTRHQ
jgi:hypothetical protein